MANTSEDMIKQMYEAQLKSQNQQLTNDYNKVASDLDVQKQQNQQATDTNLNRTAVEAQKRAMSDAEYYAAAGLTSGAKAQARMARENQLMSDMATIRAAQQTMDAEIERQRGLLAKEYDSAIRQAQAENDIAKAQALYEEAEKRDAQLLQRQQKAASLLGAAGDFSMHGTAYGLTPEQIASLQKKYALEHGNVPEGYISREELEEILKGLLAGEDGDAPVNSYGGNVRTGKKPVIVGGEGNKGANLGILERIPVVALRD